MNDTQKPQQNPPQTLSATIVDDLKARFPDLTPRLRDAARYVIDNPGEVALHSMRVIAGRAGVQHTVMQRLARELGFPGYDDFRNQFRDIVSEGWQGNWLSRVETIRARLPEGPNAAAVAECVNLEIANLQHSFSEANLRALDAAVPLLAGARRIYVLGLRSLFPVAFYFHYVCRMFSGKSVLLTGLGGTFADDLRNVERDDVLLAISYHPYAADTVRAVAFAHERGARIVAITDSHVSPILRPDGVGLIVSNTSTSLFPTPVPVLSVVQVLVTLMLAHGNSDETLAAIRRSQDQLDRFGTYLD
ncbi:MAG: MurR/RpiR family transcriptional regulator [Gemmobacter sp.]